MYETTLYIEMQTSGEAMLNFSYQSNRHKPFSTKIQSNLKLTALVMLCPHYSDNLITLNLDLCVILPGRNSSVGFDMLPCIWHVKLFDPIVV